MKEEMVWAKDGMYKDEENLHSWFEHMKHVDDWVETNPKGWARNFFLKTNAAFLFFNDHDTVLMAKFLCVRNDIINQYEAWKKKKEEEE